MDVHSAALNGDVCGVRRYLDGAGNPNLLNEQGITPLHSAAVQGQAEVIRVLVAAGGDTDLKVCRGKEGTSHDASPLLLAVLGGHLEAAQVLLETGAEVGAKNSKGLTPLHVSCLKPNVAMVRLLLLWGADTNARDRKRRTPEHVIGRLRKDPTQEDGIRAAFQQATAKKKTALAKVANTPSITNEDAPPGNTAVASSNLAEGLQTTSKPHPRVEATNHTRDPPQPPSPLPPHLPPPPPPPTAEVAVGDGAQTQTEACRLAVLPPSPPSCGSGGGVPPAEKQGPLVFSIPQNSSARNAPLYVDSAAIGGVVGGGVVPPVPVFSEPSQSRCCVAMRTTSVDGVNAAASPQLAPTPSPPPTPQPQSQTTFISSTPIPALHQVREMAPPLLPPPPQPQPQPQPITILSEPIGVPPAVREKAPMSIARGTERDRAIVTGAEAPPSAPDWPAGGEAASVATASSMRGGEAFTCGAIIAKEYELEKALPRSSGSTEIWFASKVFTGQGVVLKRVSEDMAHAFERERAVLKFLQRQGAKGEDQNSIPFLGVIPAICCLVLGRGARNLRQVVEICQWLHRLGIVWGDAKPENFVEGQDGELKAIDFDSACSLSGGVASREPDIAENVGPRFGVDHVLTPRYCAPERARSSALGELCLATKASDVWSVGMVLFWLLTGQDYFEEGLADAEVVETLCSQQFEVSLASVDPKQEQARNLLATMLSRAPERRGSIDGALGRAFFAGGASITASKMKAEMQASLGETSLRLEATLREEAGSTRWGPCHSGKRMLLDESMKRLENRANEILGKIGRMDRMLDAVVEGSTDCPRLFILTPAAGGPTLWKPDTWFSESNVLTFLCAHDLAPIGEGIKIPCPRQDLEKWAPAIQASAFVARLGCKAACMTAGVTPAAVDGMSAALGINLLAGQQVSAALRFAAGKALGDVDDGGEGNNRFARDYRSSRAGRCPSGDAAEETEGRKLTGEAYEALVSFLDETVPSWRASLARDVTKAVRGDGEVSWTCHEHAEAWRRSSLMISAEIYGVGDVDIAATAPPSGGAQPPAAKKQSASISGDKMTRAGEEGETEPDAPGCMSGTAVTPVDDPTATVVARGDEKAGSGGKGTGMAIFAKIKGRFARRTAAARTDVSRHKQEAGDGVEFDRAG